MEQKAHDIITERGFYVNAFAAIIQRLSAMDEFFKEHLSALTTKA